MIKVAVVGFGLSAKVFHLPFIEYSPFFSLTAISSSQLEAVSDSYPDIDVYENSEQMIRESGAQLIVITSPNGSHFPYAKLALESSKHVLLEKPMVTTSEQAVELAQLAIKQSRILSVYHNRRWDGDFLTLQHMLKSQDLGEIKFFSSYFNRFRPVVRDRWREKPGEGSGILYDLGSHLIDQALHLFGEPQALTANCVKLRKDSSTVDYFKILLHYKSFEVELGSSPFNASPNPRFVLQGSKGSYIKYGLDPQEEQLGDGVIPAATAFGVEPPANYGVKYLANDSGDLVSVSKIATMTGCYSEYYAQLAVAINSKLPAPVSAIEGAKVIKVIELAMQSHETGRRVDVNFSAFRQHNRAESI